MTKRLGLFFAIMGAVLPGSHAGMRCIPAILNSIVPRYRLFPSGYDKVFSQIYLRPRVPTQFSLYGQAARPIGFVSMLSVCVI